MEFLSFKTNSTKNQIDSLANNLNDFSDENISLDYADASAWISKTNGFLLPDEIIEEAYIQRNGYSVVLSLRKRLNIVDCNKQN